MKNNNALKFCITQRIDEKFGHPWIKQVSEMTSENRTDQPLMSDSDLLELVERADQNALRELYDRHSRVVYSVALRVCREVPAAEDVVQEVFLQIWRSPQQFSRLKGCIARWLAVTSRNRSIDWLRTRRRMESVDDVVLSSPYDLARDVVTNLMIERVKSLIALLPEEQRSVLEMAFFEGKTHVEIAAETGCPLGTIKTRIRAGLQSLRPDLEPAAI